MYLKIDTYTHTQIYVSFTWKYINIERHTHTSSTHSSLLT